MEQKHASLWARNLDTTISTLRHVLIQHETLWPRMAQEHGLSVRTIRSLAKNWDDTKNPTIHTLQAVADALAAVLLQRSRTSRKGT